jgi:hypothetical protein
LLQDDIGLIILFGVDFGLKVSLKTSTKKLFIEDVVKGVVFEYEHDLVHDFKAFKILHLFFFSIQYILHFALIELVGNIFMKQEQFLSN